MTIKDVIHRNRRWVVAFVYGGIICLSYLLAFYFRFEFTLPGEYYSIILKTLPALLIVKLIVFYRFGLFSGVWRYVSMDDLWQILKATLISSSIFVFYVVFAFRLGGFPRSVFVLDWMLCMGLISGSRFINRALREFFRPMNTEKNVKGLIVGAGEAGILVLKELKANLNIDVVGFIDDDPVKKGMRIHGKKVLGGKLDIKEIVETYDVKELIIAMPKEKGEIIREVVSCCSVSGVSIKIVPGMFEILSGEKEIKVREVRPEDLLGREMVDIDKDDIEKQIAEKVVLVTGAAGSIGSEITRQVLQFKPKKLILVDYNENDLYFLQREILDAGKEEPIEVIIADIKEVNVLKQVFSTFRPQIVFHAAAFKHVPLMESNPVSAVKNNIICSRNLMYASEHYGVEKFVLISSDKAVNPTNIMGATKRITEMILQAKAKKSRTQFIAVRFGNVLGSKGSVIPLFKKQIEQNRIVTVTHPEVTRFFMSIREAVQLVLEAAAIGKGGQILILNMGEQIKILDFAKDLIKLSGLIPEEDVKIEFIGLRPGEKLYEETLHNAEKDKATKNEKIFIAQPSEFDVKDMGHKVKELEKLILVMDSKGIIEKIKEIVPTYAASKGEEEQGVAY